MIRTRAAAGVMFSMAMLASAVAAPATAQDEPLIDLIPVEVANFDIVSVAPQNWTNAGNGVFSRGTPPDDLARISMAEVPASIEQLWPGLLPQLGVPEPPEVSGELRTEGYDWMLRRFDIEPGGMPLAVELALAERDGHTSIVVFQAAPEEFDILRGSVFVPALEAFATREPDITPHPSTFEYQIDEVAFPGGAEGVELAATLTRPNGPGPHPVVVLMSGSGPQDRDESLKPLTTLKPFAEIADALTSAGVAVLRYDDRGVAGSTGDYNSATISDLAADAAAAIDYLVGRDDIDAKQIGILGHSEGGLYASMLAVSDPRVSFAVLMAPGVVDGVDLLIAQNEAVLRSSGTTEEEIAFSGELAAAALPLVRDGDIEAARKLLRQYLGELWDRRSVEEQAALGERETFINNTQARQDAGWAPAWYRSLLAYDPRVDWRTVTIPVLGLFGGKDVQIVLEQNEPSLRQALKAAGNEDFETVIFPDANHLFQDAESGAVQEYGKLAPELTDGFLDTIVEWVTARTDVAG